MDCRAAFEAWFAEQLKQDTESGRLCRDLLRDEVGDYYTPRARVSWEAWRAAWACAGSSSQSTPSIAAADMVADPSVAVRVAVVALRRATRRVARGMRRQINEYHHRRAHAR